MGAPVSILPCQRIEVIEEEKCCVYTAPSFIEKDHAHLSHFIGSDCSFFDGKLMFTFQLTGVVRSQNKPHYQGESATGNNALAISGNCQRHPGTNQSPTLRHR